MKKVRQAVGYIRVSTERQAEEGHGLDVQQMAIDSFSRKKGWTVAGIWEDAKSGVGTRSFAGREGLQDAIKRAKELDAPLIVPSLSRLSRDPSSLEEIAKSGLKIISVEYGGKVSNSVLRTAIKRAHRDAIEIQEHSKNGLAAAKVKGKRLGNPTNLPLAQRKAAIANAVRAEQKYKDLAEFLRKHPRWEDLSRNALVDLLNASGSRNAISASERKQWTVSTLRKPLLKAKELLEFWEDMDAEGSSDFDQKITDISDTMEDDHLPEHGSKTALPEEISPVSRDDDDWYKDVPNYGRF